MGYVHHAINEYQLGLDVQHFLWPVYYIVILIILNYLHGSFNLGLHVIILRGSFKLHTQVV